ncbi:MAG TPA: alpha-ketoglutarate-dependent dioxygenase AlkB [Rhizomicrobium sp.]|nr:alpha-ketoglutarate-dependent dioxygenase AlkB [Rhizomicrobium sp.]
MAATQRELFAGSDLPEGFRYAGDVLTETQGRTLAEQFATLPFKPFEFHGYLGKRRIVSFGYRYDYGARALRDSTALPGFLLALREIAAEFARLPAENFEQALVTEYAPGAGIGWHRDKPMYSEVIALSFLAPCMLRFRRKRGDSWDRRKQSLAPRSAYLLSGAARWEWYHSIPGVDALRYSVTFRNFVPERR